MVHREGSQMYTNTQDAIIACVGNDCVQPYSNYCTPMEQYL